jgi:hypothetical protein
MNKAKTMKKEKTMPAPQLDEESDKTPAASTTKSSSAAASSLTLSAASSLDSPKSQTQSPDSSVRWKKGFSRLKHTLHFTAPTENAKVLQERMSVQAEPTFVPLDPLWLSRKSELLYTEDDVATGMATWDEKNGTAVVRLRTAQRLRDMRKANNIHDGLPGKKILKKKPPTVLFGGVTDCDLVVDDRFPSTKLPQERPPRKAQVTRSWEDTEVWATRAQQGAERLALVGSGVHQGCRDPSLRVQRSQSATILHRNKEYDDKDHEDLLESHTDFVRILGPPGGQPGPITGFGRGSR